jgi:thiol-disulfide isomerase/thioredoxin
MGVTPIKTFKEFKAAVRPAHAVPHMHLADPPVCMQTNSDRPVAIQFFMKDSGPCRMISPFFESLSERFPAVAFYKVDMDSEEVAEASRGIRAVGATCYMEITPED